MGNPSLPGRRRQRRAVNITAIIAFSLIGIRLAAIPLGKPLDDGEIGFYLGIALSLAVAWLATCYGSGPPRLRKKYRQE